MKSTFFSLGYAASLISECVYSRSNFVETTITSTMVFGYKQPSSIN